MTIPEITIIVPVYKVEHYLKRCLDSIVSQTFADWECILIDDGSPDNSGKICDDYAQYDNRFHVIHQKNNGVSAARNAGLDSARGEWITFIDSDDWVDERMLETLLSVAKEKNADVIVSGDKRVDDEKILSYENPIDGWLCMPENFDAYLQGPCAKLMKKSIITLNSIRFPEHVALAEDLFFTFQVFFNSKKIYGIQVSFYNYYQNSNSAVHSINEDKILDEKNVLERIENILVQNTVKKDWFEWLMKKKILCKNKAALRLKKPNCRLWKQLYPELSELVVNKSKGIKKIYFLFVYFKLNIIVDFMFFIRVSKVGV